MKLKIPRKKKKLIPSGHYCYVFTGKTSQRWNEEYSTFVSVYHTKVCPFYFNNKLGNGDCRVLAKKYGLNGSIKGQLDFCLDDQCKSCGIKVN